MHLSARSGRYRSLQLSVTIAVTGLVWLPACPQNLAALQQRVVIQPQVIDEQDVAAAEDKKAALKEKALADAGVQALLEVFPAEIRDVEEM